jgi:ankyrin repeat protein
LRRDFQIDNVEQLQKELEEELGAAYEQSLKSSQGINENNQQVNHFDRIFVNSRGHGILHMAAARGQAKTIEYLINIFKLDIDLPNQDCEETPLVCSCRNAHLEASLALLRHGADPKGHPLGQDTPLHWLWRFEKEELMLMAKGLLDAGALINAASGSMRAEVLKAHADWEGTMSISTTPLGRCVLFQNVHAAGVLIELGADPMFEIDGKSPFQLAAMLALPKFLRLFLSQGHTKSGIPGLFNGFDDVTLLKMTQEQRSGNRDTFSLLSRLVRNGPRYRSDIEETLAIFKEQRELLANAACPSGHSGEALCMQIRLGNRDIVEALLKMGHDPSGLPGYRPMREAVLLNDEKVFRLLRDYGGDIESYPEWPRTLLHDLAGRPASSPPGTIIAQYLIDSGVSVSDHPLGTRPPVVEAILHGYLDLANLLIQNGARIGCPYQLGPELPRISIFKELLEQRTKMSLSILQFLLRPNDTSAGHEPILRHNEQFNFIVDHIGDPAEEQSAWTILATSPPASKDVVEAEIYMAQVQCMLLEDSPFASKECINFDHQRFGTALCRAALFQNHFLVGKLLLSGADSNIRFRQNFGPAQRYFGDGSPANLALGCYEVAIEGWNDTVPDAMLEDMRSVINELESIRDYPDEALTRGETLRKRHKDLLSIRNDTLAMRSQMANMNLQQSLVDLSTVSAIQAPDLDESQREVFQATEVIVRWIFDSQRYGTIGRAEMARIASGENA